MPSSAGCCTCACRAEETRTQNRVTLRKPSLRLYDRNANSPVRRLGLSSPVPRPGHSSSGGGNSAHPAGTEGTCVRRPPHTLFSPGGGALRTSTSLVPEECSSTPALPTSGGVSVLPRSAPVPRRAEGGGGGRRRRVGLVAAAVTGRDDSEAKPGLAAAPRPVFPPGPSPSFPRNPPAAARRPSALLLGVCCGEPSPASPPSAPPRPPQAAAISAPPHRTGTRAGWGRKGRREGLASARRPALPFPTLPAPHRAEPSPAGPATRRPPVSRRPRGASAAQPRPFLTAGGRGARR